MKKTFKTVWQSCTLTICLLLITNSASAWNSFPIQIAVNGGNAYIESMDVGPGGDIYITGRLEGYTIATFGAACGYVIPVTEPTLTPRLFAARLHPDMVPYIE